MVFSSPPAYEMPCPCRVPLPKTLPQSVCILCTREPHRAPPAGAPRPAPLPPSLQAAAVLNNAPPRPGSSSTTAAAEQKTRRCFPEAKKSAGWRPAARGGGEERKSASFGRGRGGGGSPSVNRKREEDDCGETPLGFYTHSKITQMPSAGDRNHTRWHRISTLFRSTVLIFDPTAGVSPSLDRTAQKASTTRSDGQESLNSEEAGVLPVCILH